MRWFEAGLPLWHQPRRRRRCAGLHRAGERLPARSGPPGVAKLQSASASGAERAQSSLAQHTICGLSTVRVYRRGRVDAWGVARQERAGTGPARRARVRPWEPKPPVGRPHRGAKRETTWKSSTPDDRSYWPRATRRLRRGEGFGELGCRGPGGDSTSPTLLLMIAPGEG